MILDKQLLFIVGSPKSGTTWLQAMIGAHPSVCTTVELTLFDRYTAPWISTWEKQAANIEAGRWHMGLPFLWTEQEFYDFLREFITKVYDKVVTNNAQATHILDKHPAYSMYVEDIHKILPDARFIHVIRDGRDVAVSMMAARRKIGYGTGTVQGSAMAWVKHVRAAQQARQYRGQYIEVKYEDLLAAGPETLKSVLDFCDLPTSTKDVSDIVQAHQFERMKAKRQHTDQRVKTHEAFYRKGKAGNWQKELRPIQRYLFNIAAGDLLCELSYAKDNWWAESSNQRFILPVLAIIPRIGHWFKKRIRRAIAGLLGPQLTNRIKAIRSRKSSKI